MSFTVKKQHKMTKKLKRILLSQTVRAIKQLENLEHSPSDRIREARISFKRARTILRLLRKVIDEEKSHYYDRIYRDLGRALSTQRDLFIKTQVLKKLDSTKKKPDSLKVSNEDQQIVHEVLNKLYALKIELDNQIFGKKNFSVLRKTSIKFYNRIKQSQKHAEATKHDDEYHEWRKDVKHLYHLVSFMIPICPNEYKPMKEELHKLIHLLGDDHDLTVLRREILRKKSGKLNNKQSILLKKIAEKQKVLREKATKLGSKVVKEHASIFVNRMETNWKKYQATKTN